MKNITIVLMLMLGISYSWGQTSTLKGTIRMEDEEPAYFAKVLLLQESIFVTGVYADHEGSFQMQAKPGVYNLQVKFMDRETEVQKIVLRANKDTYLQVKFPPKQEISDCCCLTIYDPPVFSKDPIPSGLILKQEDIRHMR